MRRVTFYLVVLLCCLGGFPSQAQAPDLPPHSWLFGAWGGGLVPVPTSLGVQECLAQPVVIFTRDLVMRATFTDLTYEQRQIDTVRATPTGAEFRLIASVRAPATAGTLFGQSTLVAAIGFGCETPDVLHVQRHGENQISFPRCADFPYPLIRCVAH
jgi:hypothetical protein